MIRPCTVRLFLIENPPVRFDATSKHDISYGVEKEEILPCGSVLFSLKENFGSVIR